MRNIRKRYFQWLKDLIYDADYFGKGSHDMLLEQLHGIIFTYADEYDYNRYEDGIDLRYRFASEKGYFQSDMDIGECSVLEMLIALALRCEETIMDNPDFGNRTGKWFWMMLDNLGLAFQTDENFEPDYVEDKVGRWLNREYCKNGEGGIFVIKDNRKDMRSAEIWYQMLWYLNEYLETHEV